MRQSPHAFHINRSRWTLALLQKHCPPLAPLTSPSGVFRRLKKWHLVHKRARLHLHSPDPDYQNKVERLKTMRQDARNDPHEIRLLFADEVAFYRQPLVGPCWQERGSGQEKATLSPASNTRFRVVGSLDACTGQVVWRGGSRVGVQALCRWLEAVRAFYGPLPQVVIAWDNWWIHTHPKVVATAKAQGIGFLFLPTYAPWTNPIEKLWRKLKQEVIYLHRQADAWSELKARVGAFLDACAQPDPALLRYVGLNTLTD